MKKVINDAKEFVRETVEGIVLAYPNQIKLYNDDLRIVIRDKPSEKRKVGIITAGGSGHLPVFLGYVGEGMLDGCTVGNVFASPSANKIADTIRACNYGYGVLCLFGNYGGDKLNFELACEDVEFEDIETIRVLVTDDVASSPPESAEKRRGVSGMVYAFKIAGAKADEGADLKAVAQAAEDTIKNTRTIGFATSACIVPEVGKPTFYIAEDEIEIGMGIHGEPGIEVRKMMTADEIAEVAFEHIVTDMPLKNNDEISVMVNGLGSTPREELFIVYRRLHQLLLECGVNIFMPHIGEYATSMEMAGLSVTFLKLDSEKKKLLKNPARTPFYTNQNIL